MGKTAVTKQAMVVLGALAFGWLAIELAFAVSRQGPIGHGQVRPGSRPRRRRRRCG
ncbi:hypothetical protein FNV43_RR07284 [Rhamnella rubrinervis]|uniref:Uncharacterized protein n=1 Tax=Rhamnella rubrinervis TaxID=2594499 RepID=A0A8K0MM20_9ROSA|nr:hypothetical protein FNV43_RR07284 [Rhamnella rubrinervis]